MLFGRLRTSWSRGSVPDQLSNSLASGHKDFHDGNPKSQAIALDCEMGTATSGHTELNRLTAVNYFTQEVLIDRLVQPSVPMGHYKTNFTGVTAADMRNTVKRHECLFGRDAARSQIWKFVGPERLLSPMEAQRLSAHSYMGSATWDLRVAIPDPCAESALHLDELG